MILNEFIPKDGLCGLIPQAGAPSEVTIARRGISRWLKCTVGPGGKYLDTTGERAEVYWRTFADEGQEWRVTWETYIPKDAKLNPNSAWNFLQQFHHEGRTGVVPVLLSIWTPPEGPKIMLEVRGTDVNNPTVKKVRLGVPVFGLNMSFDMRVKWSSTEVGLVTLDCSAGHASIGNIAVPGPNLYVGEKNYPKWGYYRGASSNTTTFYHRKMKIERL